MRSDGGQQGRWERLREQQRQEQRDAAAAALVKAFKAQLEAQDPAERFAQAVSAAIGVNRRPAAPGHGERVLAEMKRDFDAFIARRQARDERLAPMRQRGWELYQRTRDELLDSQPARQSVMSPMMAAIYGDGDGRPLIF